MSEIFIHLLLIEEMFAPPAAPNVLTKSKLEQKRKEKLDKYLISIRFFSMVKLLNTSFLRKGLCSEVKYKKLLMMV